MKKVTITAIMLVIAMFMLTTKVQAYSMSFSGTKTTVEPGETFNVTVSVDEATTRANGHIKYDSSLFTFVSSTGSNMTANATSGTVQWLYSEPVGQETGTKSFTFTFKAADVTETKKGTFSMEDFIAITKDNEEGYGQDKNTIGGTSSVEVTINKKADEPSEPTWKIEPSGDFTLEKGESKQLTADEDVTWSTSDSSVATVDENGKVTGVGEGSATITATDKDGNKQTVTVTVTDNSQTPGDDDDDDKHDNWSIEPSEDFSLKVGDKKKLTADGEGVEWKSSNEKVVKVDQNGNVTAVGAGTATITATDKYGNTKTIKVTVTKKTSTVGKKDNTQSPDSKLPQTGENAEKFVVLGIAGIVLAAGIVFKKKAKELDKLFVLLPIVAVLSLSGTVHAVKLVNNTKLKTGIFYNLVEGKNVLAISPNKEFETTDKVKVSDVKNLLESVEVKKVTSVDKKELVGDDAVATGTVVTVGLKAEDAKKVNTEEKDETKKSDLTQISWNYTVLLYGDANGDGKICDASDIDIIRQDYVFNKKAEGEYKVAADLAADGKLNVRDIQRMINKYLGKLNDTVVNPFPEEEKANKGETEDVSKAVAMSKDTGKMYETVQDAANAVSRENETIILLKNTTESFIVPEDKTMILDLYGNKLTGKKEEYAILSNGNLTVMSSVAVVTNKAHYGQVNAADNGLTAITTKGSLTITTNDDKTGSTQIMLTAKKDEKDKAANIKNIGENNTILIKGGASLSGGINDHEFSFGILDEGTETTINVEEGSVAGSAGAIKKTGTGTINIGRNDQKMDDLFGPGKTATVYVGGRDAGLIVDSNVKVNFYNGSLGNTHGTTTCVNTDGTIHRFDEHRKGYGDSIGLHGGEYGQYAYYIEKDKLIAKVKSTDQTYASLGTAFSALTVTSKDKKDEVVTLLKDITESSTFPEDVTATLDLQKHTITGRENGGVTLYVEGDLTIKNGTIQTNNKAKDNENIINILMKDKGALTLEKDVELILNSKVGSNIKNVGTGNITINGASILNPENFDRTMHTWNDDKNSTEEVATVAETKEEPKSYGINDEGLEIKGEVDESNSDITITSGYIEGDCAIYKKDEGTITIGNKDGNIEMGNPQIVGHESGIDGNSGSDLEVHFYDGIIKALKKDAVACGPMIDEFEKEITVEEDEFDEENEDSKKYVLVGSDDGEDSEIYYETVEEYKKELEAEKKEDGTNGGTDEESGDDNGAETEKEAEAQTETESEQKTTPTAQTANSAAAMALELISNL